MLNPALEQHIRNARILIVDDESAHLRLIERFLESAGYANFAATCDSRQVEALISEQKPDLLLLDLMMPHRDGFEIMAAVKARSDSAELMPIVVLTADESREARHRALSAGALDFLVKPLDQIEVLLRVHHLLTLSYLLKRERERADVAEGEAQARARQLEESNRLLQHANAELASANEHLQWAHREIEQAQDEIVSRLVEAVEMRGESSRENSAQQSSSVARLAEELARAMGLDQRQIELIRHAAPLHDIGKIGVSDAVLLKPTPLTSRERDEARSHVEIGASMLGKSQTLLMQMAQSIAYTHHERWDGHGYPRGLKGEETPIEGRILAVVDVFDALTTERPYKQAWSPAQALAEIEAQSAQQFDPAVVSAFSQLMKKVQIQDSRMAKSTN